MGFQRTDFVPLGNISPITPPGKAELHKVFTVSRTDTVSSVKAMLPAAASVVGVYLYGSVASNAATTAAVTLTIANNGGTVSTGAIDVKTNGAVTALAQMSNLPNEQPIPANGDLKISAVYAESGTASSTGGPWKVRVAYVQ